MITGTSFLEGKKYCNQRDCASLSVCSLVCLGKFAVTNFSKVYVYIRPTPTCGRDSDVSFDNNAIYFRFCVLCHVFTKWPKHEAVRMSMYMSR